ncbi:hypothetical protein SPSYN_02097 [Sporotomaculum syntrophicum]|uniref:Uncharacterized protein n=1 Tax=Sporotomaculum syntrophicum TaxID=182264 RepID=A0A9D2WP25_9FIRM|nr:hypothetical protein SPSYN_02097 [Sporotomaculum syntrophicum]
MKPFGTISGNHNILLCGLPDKSYVGAAINISRVPKQLLIIVYLNSSLYLAIVFPPLPYLTNYILVRGL